MTAQQQVLVHERPGVDVIVVLAVVAAVVMFTFQPHVATPGAHSDVQLKRDLATVRNALAVYASEHDGHYPGPDVAAFVQQLTTYTDVHGNRGTADDVVHAYRRYLLRIPPCPVEPAEGMSWARGVLVRTETPLAADESAQAGWLYNPATGEFVANSSKRDARGARYDTY